MLLSAYSTTPALLKRENLTPRVLRGLETCARAIAELASTLSRHPLEAAWGVRYALRQAVRLSKLDGFLVDEHRLAGYLAGLPVPFRHDQGAEVRALAYARRLLAALEAGWPPPPPPADRLVMSQDPGLDLPAWNIVSPEEPFFDGYPRLFLVAHRLLDARTASPSMTGEAHEILVRDLARFGLAKSPLPLIAAGLGATPAAPAEAYLAAFLAALEADARDGLRFLGTLALSWEVWRMRIGARRSQSRLPALVDLAAASPILAPVTVARHLGCSVRAASMMLEELVELEVLIEVSGRRTWKAYAGADYSDLKDDLKEGWRPFLLPRKATAAPATGAVVVYGAVAPEASAEADDRGEAPLKAAPKPAMEAKIIPARVDQARMIADADRAIRQAKAALAGREPTEEDP